MVIAFDVAVLPRHLTDVADDGVPFLFGKVKCQIQVVSDAYTARCLTANMAPTNLASVYEDRVQNCPPDETCRSSYADSCSAWGCTGIR